LLEIRDASIRDKERRARKGAALIDPPAIGEEAELLSAHSST
jgi:hypothetical protein